MLIHGIGTDPDPGRGVALVETAAAASVREAWFELGNLHRLGKHLVHDPHAAIAAYRAAAERGHVRAQHALGNMYGNGDGVGVDLVTACKWWRLAARKGHELAAHALRLATSMMTPAEIGLPGARPRDGAPNAGSAEPRAGLGKRKWPEATPAASLSPTG